MVLVPVAARNAKNICIGISIKETLFTPTFTAKVVAYSAANLLISRYDLSEISNVQYLFIRYATIVPQIKEIAFDGDGVKKCNNAQYTKESVPTAENPATKYRESSFFDVCI